MKKYDVSKGFVVKKIKIKNLTIRVLLRLGLEAVEEVFLLTRL